MSKIGKQKIKLSSEINTHFQDNTFTAEGSKGKLSIHVFDSINLTLDKEYITLTPKVITNKTKSLWGLTRSLINNMIIGVTKGFVKKLEINGVGYKVKKDEDLLILSLGYSHDIIYPIPSGIVIVCNKNIIEVNGCDKQLVGQVCADIRNLRKPEPYKGKGIKYEKEIIVRKEGKKK